MSLPPVLLSAMNAQQRAQFADAVRPTVDLGVASLKAELLAGDVKPLLQKIPAQHRAAVLAGTISPAINLTPYIQEALDDWAGSAIQFPRGRLFVRQALLVSSNTSVFLDTGCALVTDTARWVDSGLEKVLTGDAFAGADIGCMLVNRNWASDTDDDENISIFGGFFLRDATGAGNRGHALFMRNVTDVLIDNVSVRNGWNATALLSCVDTIVTNSIAHNVTNCAFDQWEGAGNAFVDGCTIRVDPGRELAQGVQVSGMATDGTAKTSFAFRVSNCYAQGVRSPSGFSSAYIANAIGAGSSVQSGVFSNCIADDVDNGLVLQGDVSCVEAHSLILRKATKGPIVLTNDPSGEPSNCTVSATLIDCASDNALVSMRGTRNDVHVRLVDPITSPRSVRFETTAVKCTAKLLGAIDEDVAVQDDNPEGFNLATWADAQDSVIFTKGSGNADLFTLGQGFRQLLQPGSVGHFEAVHLEMDGREYGSAGKFLVALQAIGASNSSGNVFGIAGYARIGTSAASSVEASGAEFNTDVRCATVARKTGVQAVDVATSIGMGTAVDAAFWAARQTGGVGYVNGLQFGNGTDSEFPLRNGTANALVSVKSGLGVSIGYGLDLSNITFSQAAIGLRAGVAGHRVSWGIGASDNRLGGEIRSDAATAAGKVIFINGGLVLQSSGGVTGLQVDNDGTNPLTVTVAGLTRRVEASATPPPGSLLLYVAP